MDTISKVTPGIRNFIIANKIYFKDIVFNYKFTKGELHYYVGEQIEWYNSKPSDDTEWDEMHKIMGKSKIQHKDVDVITDIIWGWKKYGFYIPNVTPAKKTVKKEVPIMKRELEL